MMVEADQGSPGGGTDNECPCAVNRVKDPAIFGVGFFIGKFLPDDAVIGKAFQNKSAHDFFGSSVGYSHGVVNAFFMFFLHVKFRAKVGGYDLCRTISKVVQDVFETGQISVINMTIIFTGWRIGP